MRAVSGYLHPFRRASERERIVDELIYQAGNVFANLSVALRDAEAEKERRHNAAREAMRASIADQTDERDAEFDRLYALEQDQIRLVSGLKMAVNDARNVVQHLQYGSGDDRAY